jgi:hypothetical protein
MHNLPSDFAEDSHFQLVQKHRSRSPGPVPEIDATSRARKCFGLHERDRERQTQARRLAILNSHLDVRAEC